MVMEIIITSHMGSFAHGDFGYGKYKQYTATPELYMLNPEVEGVNIITVEEAKSMVLASCVEVDDMVIAAFADDDHLKASRNAINILHIDVDSFKNLVHTLKVSMWMSVGCGGRGFGPFMYKAYKESDNSIGKSIRLRYFEAEDGRNANKLMEMGFVVKGENSDIGRIISPSYQAMRVAIDKLDYPLIQEVIDGELVAMKKEDYEVY